MRTKASEISGATTARTAAFRKRERDSASDPEGGRRQRLKTGRKRPVTQLSRADELRGCRCGWFIRNSTRRHGIQGIHSTPPATAGLHRDRGLLRNGGVGGAKLVRLGTPSLSRLSFSGLHPPQRRFCRATGNLRVDRTSQTVTLSSKDDTVRLPSKSSS